MTSLPLRDRLSIRLSADGFSFCTLTRQTDGEGKPTHNYVELKTDPGISMAANVKQLLERGEAFPYRNGDFLRTDILMDVGERYTTVPLELFEDDEAETIYDHVNRRKAGEMVVYNVLDRTNVVVLFAVEKNTYALLKELFPTAKVWAGISPLVEQMAKKSRGEGVRKVILCPRKRKMDVMAFEHGRPLMVNTYSCRDVSDCVYYTLNAWNALGLNQEHDELCLIGMGHPEENKVGDELQKFIRHVSVEDVKEGEKEIPYDLLALWHSGM